ncbi:DNA internalization-related competence protein ComEC/Rec2 [Alkalihalobacillus sp. TS-13]|uniref:DNA internalization-related competence protein ComEC/Rec2 n=1 Tax=Alkalihalobacillus sp. TS-13 TaxID=2842455 RepID=UPI001C88DF28|nr:DNA internalization-related competence protein ComEC/Rec2 [Alkalihalobacillus sp. TS-13]
MKIHFIAITAILGILTTPTRWWLGSFLISYLIINFYQKRLSFLTCIVLTGIYLFFVLYTPFYTNLHATRLPPDETFITGTIISTPNIDGNRITFRLKLLNKEKILVKHKIQTEKEQVELNSLYYGDVCRFSGALELPDANRNFYGFNYRTYLKNTFNIHWIFKTTKLSITECVRGKGILTALHRFRQDSIGKINEEFPVGLRGMMNTLIFGDRNGIEEDLQERYQSLGLIHLLAVSGLHVGTILGLIYFLLIRAGVVKETALWILLLSLPFIILLTGGAPSVIRAGLMAAVVCLILLLRIKMTTFNQMCMILLGLLLFKPTYIYSIGFQLSFLITALLILSSKTILRDLSLYKQLMYGSFIAQIASLPLVLWNFYEFSIWSLPLNMIFIPFMTIVLLPCILLTFFMFLLIPFPMWELPSTFLSFIFKCLHLVMQWVDNLPLGLMTLGRPNAILLFGIVLSFYYLLVSWELNFKRLLLPFIFIMLLIGIQFVHQKLNANAYVTFLDVGQGDAIVIELPFRKAVYVIDTGGIIHFNQEKWMERSNEFDTGEDIVADFLKARGIRKVDALILSHGDLDHIGGTEGLLEEVRVEQVVYGKSDHLEASELAFLKGLGTPIQLLEENVSWKIGSSSFQTLNPGQARESRNNRSLVLYADIHDNTFLFTGDIDHNIEERILKDYPTLEVDYVKVAHHGSDTSTSQPFINRINPKASFISVGANNRYNHPSSSVIERLENHNIDIFRTDEHGAIMVIISPDQTRIKTVSP